MKTRIILDSGADLKPSVQEKCILIPLSLRFADEEFLDGVTIGYRTFYEKLVKCDTLSIKPVAGIRDGEVALLGKARGSRQANNLLVKEIEKVGGVDFSKPVLLGYTGMSDVLLKKYIEDSSNLWQELGHAPDYSPIGSVIGTHVGPGAVAAAFFKKGALWIRKRSCFNGCCDWCCRWCWWALFCFAAAGWNVRS